jgi:hypothetical protein
MLYTYLQQPGHVITRTLTLAKGLISYSDSSTWLDTMLYLFEPWEVTCFRIGLYSLGEGEQYMPGPS